MKRRVKTLKLVSHDLAFAAEVTIRVTDRHDILTPRELDQSKLDLARLVVNGVQGVRYLGLDALCVRPDKR